MRDELEFGGRFTLSAGLRADYVKFEVDDFFPVSDANPDDSGDRTLAAWSPMVGLVAQPDAAALAVRERLDAHSRRQRPPSSATRPTAPRDSIPSAAAAVHHVRARAEGNRAESRAVRSRRLRHRGARRADPVRGAGREGRTYYRNAGRTRRQGIEAELMHGHRTRLPSPHRTRTRTSASATTTWTTRSYAGNDIPAFPVHQVQGSATWRYFARCSRRSKGRGRRRSGSTIRTQRRRLASRSMNIRVGGTALFGRPWLAPTIGLQNVFDKHYMSSVAINAAAGKFYEPSAGRRCIVGLTAAIGH